MSKISIIIPVFNEELTINSVLTEVMDISSNIDCEVIVVDDGSTDNTSDIIKDRKFIRVIRHPYNKGYGASVKTGINNSTHDKIVLIDADSQHNPSDIELLLSHLGEFDLVVGSRNADSESNVIRKTGNYFLRKLAGLLVEMDIPDLTSGFRAFNKAIMLKFMHLYPNGFSISATTVLAFISAGFNVKFVPIKMYTRCLNSKSKINLVKDGFKFTLLVLRILTLFNPLKIFFPISLLLFIVGSSYGILNIFFISHIPAGAVLLVIASFIIFFFGLIADQISCIRRDTK